ncbi:bifunctional sugar phosphate isomerase/epimerase/4-hydroxyphenylpyruvate dioxygenase family protein [Mycolicibacterium vaccae]|uniref:3-dehydroshikimate dehydratase n=1 Tax=Mycolicibacterium vaccae ATCC 25954 TaxID=1194972 RepID=K0UJM6_MYCVA|nr:sugar phosphate isomerase/epimerase and 4-hydroxyphenylpyruvate domain-containing protein [Mycolicibacterium vaccae]EJZ07382.1 sugar phosphate isomerase/epimerase [Mycolicibacterium vaccae ATCC 25954]MCV7062950.1 sugar phosphate isomerase/epimerase and 4-hydroxyphenylpyruvate domain-containing protein [Mycolicibacterium vaccae]
MRTSIATVSLSGSLVDKLHACAAAGFDGVEIFEPDLIASDHSPEEIRALARRLGLTLDLYQPLRDLEGVDEHTFADNLRRAAATFATAQRLGIDTVLVCSNVATATIDSDDVSADQLRRIGDVAQSYGVRIAFEALAWGRFIDDYRRAWRVVEVADHPAVGVCLDSFHVLSRGHDPAAITDIPAEKIFYLQLADAPALSMDVLSWSRHHRLFPGEGAFDLTGFVTCVLAAGYDGPLSLEVFNDTFRQTDPGHTAVHALRSLLWLQDKVAAANPEGWRPALTTLVAAKPPTAFDFVELKAEDTTEVEVLLGQLGFAMRGRHRTKPVSLWSAGDARIVLNEQQARDRVPHVAAIGLQVPDAGATSSRAAELMAPLAYRRTYAAEQPFGAAVAPDGTQFFWISEVRGVPDWVVEFEAGMPDVASPVRVVDHVNLTQPWQTAEDAVLFLTSVFGLTADAPIEVPGPTGLVRSQVMRTVDGAIRLPLNVAPHVMDSAGLAQHVAFACTDVVALARSAAARGLQFLPVPDNYYDYLHGRFGLDGDELAELRELNLLYDRGPRGHFVHFYTRTVGSVFFEFVQRFGDYDGYGVDNAPVRLAAQH